MDRDDKPADTKTCDKCREAKPDAKHDRGTRMILCNACWFTTPPRFG